MLHRFPYFILFSFILLGVSCAQKEENKFFNLTQINQDIKDSTGIDLFSLKKKIDASFPNEDSLYIRVNLEVFQKRTTPIFDMYGYTTHIDNGDSIRLENMHDIIDQIAHALGRGIKQGGCIETDSICREKKEYHNSLITLESENSGIVAGTEVYDYMLGLYRREFINYEEFSYLMIMMHILVSMESQRAIWWHDLSVEERREYLESRN